jgi:hypothetical protein
MKTKTMKFAMMMMPAALLGFTSCSSSSSEQSTKTTQTTTEDSPQLSETGRGGIVIDAMKEVYTVKSVNSSDRIVVLQEADGSLTSVECGPEVRNFDQIKVGDKVTATVAESLAIGLVKGGELPAGASTATAVVRSPTGAKPGGKIVDTVAFTAKVMGVDVPNRHVILQKPDGENETVRVGPDINLADINPGDQVGVRATRSFAIKVTDSDK